MDVQEEDVNNQSEIANFYETIRQKLTKKGDIPAYFVYFHTVLQGRSNASVADISEYYDACDLGVPSWLASHFSNGLIGKNPIYIKRDGGYRLEQQRKAEISESIDQGQTSVHTNLSLTALEAQLAEGPKRDFLHETIVCFSVNACRAAVVMCWNLALHHLQEYVLSNTQRLQSFNNVLALNTDKRVKISSVSKQDDFTEMPEGKFLHFCRESKLITATVFKKLENKLDERNSAAHPSGTKVTPKMAEAFIEDLLHNVLLKYSI